MGSWEVPAGTGHQKTTFFTSMFLTVWALNSTYNITGKSWQRISKLISNATQPLCIGYASQNCPQATLTLAKPQPAHLKQCSV